MILNLRLLIYGSIACSCSLPNKSALSLAFDFDISSSNPPEFNRQHSMPVALQC